MATKKQELDFETSLAELEQLVQKMEQGDLTLEQSLAAFERGVSLTRECQQRLQQAEQRVQLLIEQNNGSVAQPFETDSEA